MSVYGMSYLLQKNIFLSLHECHEAQPYLSYPISGAVAINEQYHSFPQKCCHTFFVGLV